MKLWQSTRAAEYQGIDTDQAIWQYFHHHWLILFSGLLSRTTLVRQATNLWQSKERLQHCPASDRDAQLELRCHDLLLNSQGLRFLQ